MPLDDIDYPSDLPVDPVETYSSVDRWGPFGAPPVSTEPEMEAVVDIPTTQPDVPAPGESVCWSVLYRSGDDPNSGGKPESYGLRPGEPGAAPSYELLRVVGRGGYGEVWESRQYALDRLVAVKMIPKAKSDELRMKKGELKRAIGSFRREAMTAALLEHPNIVPVHDLGEDELGFPLLAMKLVRGETWSKILAREFEELPEIEFLGRNVHVLIDVAQAVAYAHSKGIVHRDIKPAQVMTGKFGETYLMDWGLAVYVGEPGMEMDDGGSQTYTSLSLQVNATLVEHARNPAGTPALMAPEQTLDTTEKIGFHTDVYLLGATLYFMLTGAYPHKTGSTLESMKRARAGVVEHPRKRAPGREIPAELAALCMKCMEKEPEDRVGSAEEFVDGLQDWLSGASSRSQSRELVAKAKERLVEQSSPDYATLAACGKDLDRAQALWTGNPGVASLREQVAVEQTKASVKRGDLGLARLVAEGMEKGSLREDAMREVSAAESAAAARERNRKTTLAASFVMLALVIAVTLMSYARLKTQQEELYAAKSQAETEASDARRQRRAAEEARAIAVGDQAMMETMLADLKAASKAGDSAAVEHYGAIARRFRDAGNRPGSAKKPSSGHPFVPVALEALAGLRQRQGDGEEAANLRAQVVSATEGLDAASPGASHDALVALARALADSGRQDEALAIVESALLHAPANADLAALKNRLAPAEPAPKAP